MIEAYFLHLFIIVCIYVILSVSLNVAIGYTGLLNLGHVAFYAIGAYTSALLALNFGVPFWISLVAAGVMAMLFGFLISFPTVKLKGDYLVLGTLGFSIIVEAILKNWTSLTRGPLGLPGIPKPEMFGITFNSLETYALLALAFALITYVLLSIIVRSPFGRILKAIRDDEVAAETLGKNTFKAKAKALMISAFFAGIAGSLYAHYITFIDPSTFSIMETVLVLSMVLIGGTGSLMGSVAGAALLVLLPEPLRFIKIPYFVDGGVIWNYLPSAILGGMRQALYAILLVGVVLKRPQGLLGEDTFHSAWRSVKKRWTS